MEYQRIAAAGFFRHPVRMHALSVVVLERCPGGSGGLVFGTLLGPEATGPGAAAEAAGSGTCVSGFLAAPGAHGRLFLWKGLCVGCVVRGCCLRTT